ncbi:hypothetical protein DFH09DRAFT_1320144 [Mycena vulgaris]|nr:hypothetical protein DFH09DRAFT_1320144 [Mycena vulgaris]
MPAPLQPAQRPRSHPPAGRARSSAQTPAYACQLVTPSPAVRPSLCGSDPFPRACSHIYVCELRAILHPILDAVQRLPLFPLPSPPIPQSIHPPLPSSSLLSPRALQVLARCTLPIFRIIADPSCAPPPPSYPCSFASSRPHCPNLVPLARAPRPPRGIFAPDSASITFCFAFLLFPVLGGDLEDARSTLPCPLSPPHPVHSVHASAALSPLGNECARKASRAFLRVLPILNRAQFHPDMRSSQVSTHSTFFPTVPVARAPSASFHSTTRYPSAYT